jgi:hypothetical protein
MGLTNFPGGIASFGMPVLPGLPPTTGSVFFVCNASGASGSDSNSGLRPDQPLATIAKAITLATASKGDQILVMPGHTEAVIAAGTLTISKAGVQVIGLGTGRLRPVITYTTAAAASVDITAANVLVQNIVFKAVGVDAVTAAMNITAADVTVRDCEFELADATNQAVLGLLTTAAADRLRLERCHFHGTTDAGTAAAVRLVGGTDQVITDCVMVGAYTTSKGGVDNITTACVNLTVNACIISNLTASATVCINLVATTTGSVSNCRLSVLSGTAPIVGAALNQVGGNYYKAAAGVGAGTLL